jgi:hypothetical protein
VVNWHSVVCGTGREEHLWLCRSCTDARTPPEGLQRFREARARGEKGTAISGWTSYNPGSNKNDKS